jgi:Ca2+-binding RTX toxin-like protein
VIAGPGRDTVDGGGGGDTIRVRDGERDVVDCGTEQDTVIADGTDVLRHCERVRRS